MDHYGSRPLGNDGTTPRRILTHDVGINFLKSDSLDLGAESFAQRLPPSPLDRLQTSLRIPPTASIIHAQSPASRGGREAACESSGTNERHVYLKWTGRKIDRAGYAPVGSWRACECLRHAQPPAMDCAWAVGLVKLLSPWPTCRLVVLAPLQAIAGHERRPAQSLRRCSIDDSKRTFFTNLEQDNRKENQAFFLKQTSAAPVPTAGGFFHS